MDSPLSLCATTAVPDDRAARVGSSQYAESATETKPVTAVIVIAGRSRRRLSQAVTNAMTGTATASWITTTEPAFCPPIAATSRPATIPHHTGRPDRTPLTSAQATHGRSAHGHTTGSVAPETRT